MAQYIALLRGINVGKNNAIGMADLKRMFEELGLDNVQTYIRSGNVLFQSEDSEDVLRIKIENEIEKRFGFSVAVILRTDMELKHIIENCPFSEEEIAKAESLFDGECLYIALMGEVPLQENIQHWGTYRNDSNKYKFDGRNVFLLFHHSIRDSKLASQIHKLGVPVTIRNLNTINKLVDLAGGVKK